MTSKTLIIPAAGVGRRMNTDLPKPYLTVAGKTILEHSLNCFVNLPGLKEVIIPVSEPFFDESLEILQNLMPGSVDCKCVEGGRERQQSVGNALDITSMTDLVIVHDAVRPFVEMKHIEQCCRVAEEEGAAVLGVPVKDTIKKVGAANTIIETPDRSEMWQAQTPQVFRREVLVSAYKKAAEDNFQGTDDASLVERNGDRIKIVKGSGSNFKITYQLDLKLATLLLENRK